MLVLTREEGQVVQVGNGAIIVLRVRPGEVKLGFVFGDDVHIMRDEIADGRTEAAQTCKAKFRAQQDARAQSQC